MNYRSICPDCVHFHGEDSDDAPDLVTCLAFPAGIPDEILRQGFDHRNPYDGDNGVMFTPRKPVDVDKLEAIVNPPKSRNPKNW